MNLLPLLAAAIIAAPIPPDEPREPIATDRPDFTETAETVPFRLIQLESGYTFSRIQSDKQHTTGEMLLRIATGRRTEARIGVSSFSTIRGPGGNISGFEDASLGFKVKLLDGSEKPGFGCPNVALIGAATFPSGAYAFRENAVQPEAKLCFAWDLTDRIGMGSNLNYGYASEGGRRFSQFSGTLSFSYSLSDRMGAYLEYFTVLPSGYGGSSANYVDGGFTFLVNSEFQLDARAGVGLNSASPDYFAGVGASWRW